jgi:hypothetical protein
MTSALRPIKTHTSGPRRAVRNAWRNVRCTVGRENIALSCPTYACVVLLRSYVALRFIALGMVQCGRSQSALGNGAASPPVEAGLLRHHRANVSFSSDNCARGSGSTSAVAV